jgi:hypothetical protein
MNYGSFGKPKEPALQPEETKAPSNTKSVFGASSFGAFKMPGAFPQINFNPLDQLRASLSQVLNSAVRSDSNYERIYRNSVSN